MRTPREVRKVREGKLKPATSKQPEVKLGAGHTYVCLQQNTLSMTKHNLLEPELLDHCSLGFFLVQAEIMQLPLSKSLGSRILQQILHCQQKHLSLLLLSCLGVPARWSYLKIGIARRRQLRRLRRLRSRRSGQRSMSLHQSITREMWWLVSF